MNCRHCNAKLEHPFIDLGEAPPSNAYLSTLDSVESEVKYPLRVMVCHQCWLVQTEDFASAETYFADEYAYFSSVSKSWLEHSKHYVSTVVERFDLGPKSTIVEVAANDGYLLQYVKDLGIRCYGIEPTASTAKAARAKGLEIVEEFFGQNLAEHLCAENKKADLIAANNVLAHVPDINDFVRGFSVLLKEGGVATFEFPHLCELIKHSQFDTIYHEHFSYLSLSAVQSIFVENGLQIFDVEKLTTHGGSLRVFAQRSDIKSRRVEQRVNDTLTNEAQLGVHSLHYYQAFDSQVQSIKIGFLEFLKKAENSGKKVAAYGAAAKGNTLLNYTGVGVDAIPYVVDRNIEKQGKFLPGSHIPIVDEAHLKDDQPDFIVIFPWNIEDEVRNQLQYAKDWGASFVTTVPELVITRA